MQGRHRGVAVADGANSVEEEAPSNGLEALISPPWPPPPAAPPPAALPSSPVLPSPPRHLLPSRKHARSRCAVAPSAGRGGCRALLARPSAAAASVPRRAASSAVAKLPRLTTLPSRNSRASYGATYGCSYGLDLP